MKDDLDQLMDQRGLAALVVPIDETYSSVLDYLAGPVKITDGLAIKPAHAEPVLFVSGMEVEEAAATGLTVHTLADMGWHALRAEYGSAVSAEVALWGRCLEHLGVREGKVGIYGTGSLHRALAMLDKLRAAHPQYAFSGEVGRTLFDDAFITKDADNLARIRDVARRTNTVMQATWDFISTHDVQQDTLIQPDETPLTIGDVKQFVRKTLLEHDLEDTGMIFAQGHDGAFPHSRGTAHDPLRLGQPIVFDLFPREFGGGYYHDMTRTWCPGYAPEHVQKLYGTVMTAFDIALQYFSLGTPTYLMQTAVQDYFESLGHPTARSMPGTSEGYVHGLGHGVGLEIHEKPRISHLSSDDVFAVGNVITIEPGLYYPEQNVGVRIEDTFYVNDDGSLESLTPFPKTLILPVKGYND